MNAFISKKKRKDFEIQLHGEGYEFLKLADKDCEVLNVTKEQAELLHCINKLVEDEDTGVA